MVSEVCGFKLMVSRVRGTWFREYEVHNSEGTRVRGM